MSQKKYNFVNAHINNISFPKTIEELETFIYENGCYNVEDILNEAQDGYVIWTVPRSSVIGDIVLYYHAKTALQSIRSLKRIARNLDGTEYDKELIEEWLKRAEELYSLYGGKIFAIGKISSTPEREDESEFPYHWSSRIYAKVQNLYLLETPIDISEFKSFIMISRQSAITPLPSKEFEQLKTLIQSKSPNIPKWFLESKIENNNLSKVNQNNFLEFTKPYRKRFPLEINFRSYYVDYFLKVLSGKNVYSECQCHSEKTPNARVDNVFEFNNKKILLEVKLNINLESDLIAQLNKYIYADYIQLSQEKDIKITNFEKEYMFVVDVYSFYKYYPKQGNIIKLFDLDDIKDKSDIISKIQKVIIEA